MWYVLVTLLLLLFIYNNMINGGVMGSKENFVSGEEKLMVNYDQIYPLDHPKYVTPQQKDFQVVLSEHSALDPNLQNRRPDIKTTDCNMGSHCFNTREWHSLNYQYKSAPDVINTLMKPKPVGPQPILYQRHESDKVVPFNSISREMRADLFDDIMIPDLFFSQRRMINKGEPHPDERSYATEIY